MRKQVIAAAAASGLVLMALPSDAAAKPQLTDPQGDSVIAGADIVSATFATTFKKVRTKKKKVRKVTTGFTLTLKLAAPAADNVWFAVRAAGPGCAEFNFDANTSQLGPGPEGAGCAVATPPSTNYISGVTPRISGSSVVWRVPESKIPKGSKFRSISAVTYNMVTTPVGVVSLGFPAWDEATAPASRTFVVGK